ncbi:MAG TPA: hypothetical protein VGN26_06170 [Armatimonadota bacterium]|jgi:hypothetical protein
MVTSNARRRRYLAGSLLMALSLSLLGAAPTHARKAEGPKVLVGPGTELRTGKGKKSQRVPLDAACSLAMDRADTLFLVDAESHSLVRVEVKNRRAQVLVGPGAPNDPKRGPAAQLSSPSAILSDRHGSFYVADTGAACVVKVDDRGRVTPVAGTGRRGSSADGGPASESPLQEPVALALDSDENLYIADAGDCRVRRVDRDKGLLTTVAGTGECRSEGDGNPARQASLADPCGLAFDREDNLYILERGSGLLRRVDKETRTITTVAGKGTSSGATALSTPLPEPSALVADREGNLFVGLGNGTVLRFGAKKRFVTLVADRSAGLRRPVSLAVVDNTLYVVDGESHEVVSIPLPKSLKE